MSSGAVGSQICRIKRSPRRLRRWLVPLANLKSSMRRAILLTILTNSTGSLCRIEAGDWTRCSYFKSARLEL
jgi:hypothetical protein